jgi:hypothetical protein
MLLKTISQSKFKYPCTYLPLILPGAQELGPLCRVDVRREDLLGVNPHGAHKLLVYNRGLFLLRTSCKE